MEKLNDVLKKKLEDSVASREERLLNACIQAITNAVESGRNNVNVDIPADCINVVAKVIHTLQNRDGFHVEHMRGMCLTDATIYIRLS